MTVKALPGGGIYHATVRTDGTTDEHVTQTPIRRTPTAYVLYCAGCDAVSVIYRGTPSEELRNVELAISSEIVAVSAGAEAPVFQDVVEVALVKIAKGTMRQGDTFVSESAESTFVSRLVTRKVQVGTRATALERKVAKEPHPVKDIPDNTPDSNGGGYRFDPLELAVEDGAVLPVKAIPSDSVARAALVKTLRGS